MSKFAKEPVNKDNVSSYYGSIDVKVYDEFVASIDFQDPVHLTQIISEAESQELQYGLLNLPKDAAIFDMAHGTGSMGRLLSEKGYTSIEGADATAEYVKHCAESGWYKKTYEMYLGLPRG